MRWLLVFAVGWAFSAKAAAPTMTNLNPTTRPSARTGATLVSSGGSAMEALFLFGGNATLAGTNNQTWAYDVTSNTWAQRTVTGAPASRAWHSMSWDAALNRVVLFGGSRDLNGPLLNDVYLFDPATNAWQQLTSTGAPSPRFLASMVYAPDLGAHLLFGGGTATSANAEATTLSNELYRLTINLPAGTATWALLTPAGTAPAARASSCVGYDRVRRRLHVFGGEIVNDTITAQAEYDVATDTWLATSAQGMLPTKRGSAVCTYDARADKLILYGGVTSPSGNPISEAWTYEPALNLWTRVMPSPSAGNATFSAPTFSTQLGGMVFFGGRTSLIGVSQATWSLRVNASPRLSPIAPASVAEAAMSTRPAPMVTDADGDPLVYQWLQLTGPDAGIAGETTATPTITTPRLFTAATLTYSVIVSDGFDRSDGGFVMTVNDTINEPPTADAGPNQTVDAGAMVTLDGRGSVDPNGEPLVFIWAQTSGPGVGLPVMGTTSSFVAPAGPTSIGVRLTATDPRSGAATANVVITVRGAVGGGPGGGSAGGASGGSAGGAAGGSAGGASGGSAGGASGGSAGGASGGSAGGAAGGSAGGAAGGSAGGAAGGAAAGGGTSGGSSDAGAFVDGGLEASGDAGVELPETGFGPVRQFGVGCGCASVSDLSAVALALFIASRSLRHKHWRR